MPEIEYLTPQEWADVLVKDAQPDAMAEALRAGKYWSWTETLLQYSHESDEVLDLGSGAGENAAVLARHGRRMTLLDWSERNLDFDRRLFTVMGLNGHFVQHDMTQPLPFADNSFDLVFSCGVFEYFTDEQIRGIVQEALRIARQRIIILVPNARSLAYRLGKWYLETRGRWHWGRERPFRTLRPHFRATGCAQVTEFCVATKHSLDFLVMRGGPTLQRLLIRLLRLTDHSKPAAFGQGYLLVTIGEKNAEGSARA
jgi:SAM-dependent methyltransferase